ncbi:AT-rich interactive domain-containing protein 2 [Schistosoma japonicum]|nr:AT-rich interactive domain-containing protein 2 [Schistosoma japonicum]KAH8873280.1 AT-rich interactive domain-containing protein 2 [Schistosoma japonicum]
MNKNRRSVSCPTFISRTNRTLRREVSDNRRLLKRIQRHYHRRWPRLLGKPIKLTDLFVAVISRGGYKRVCDRGWWSDVARELSLPTECGNASIGLRRIYYQFLSHFEFKEYPSLSEQFFLQTLAEPDVISEDASLPLSSVERILGIGTLHNNAHMTSLQSPVDLFDRSHRARLFPVFQEWGNKDISGISQDSDIFESISNPDEFPDVYEPTQLRLVESALCSGLPNEIEVALNSLLVLSITPSSGSSSSVRLAHCTNLLSLLVASVGIYGEGFGSYISCDETWRRQNQLNFLKFWYSVVREPSGRIFLRPDVFINIEHTVDEIGTNEEKAVHELFAPYSSKYHGTQWPMEGFEGSRVLLIATILVNLVTPPPVAYASVVEDDDDELDFGPIIPCNLFPSGLPLVTWRENARVIAGSPNALRFIFLCAYAHHSGLKSLGLQLLSSIRYPLDPPSLPLPLDCPEYWTPLIDNGCRLGQLTLAFVTRCILESNDRCDLIAGLMFLANLTKVREKMNLSSLLVGLPQTVWPRLAQLLCLPDLAIVCATLEALRCLTNLDATICLTCWESCCLNVNYSLDHENIPLILLQPLLALLTLEGQAMGSQSLHRIRLLPRSPQTQNIQSQLPRHGSGLRIPIQCRLPPNNPNEVSRFRDAPYTNGQMFKSYLRPKPPSVIHPVSSDPFDNDSRNPSTASSFRNLRFEPSTLLKQSTISSMPTCISHPVYRPQSSGSTACSGLINLLSSTPSTSSTPNNINISAVNSTSPNSPKSAAPPSLSELTDRLQMPPPSLPPPSAMRRSMKRVHSRTSSLISSPTQQLADKLRMNISDSVCSTNNHSSGNIAVNDRIISSTTSLPLTTSCNLNSESKGDSVTSGVPINSKEIQRTTKHVHKSSNENLSDSTLNEINDSQNLLPHLTPIVNHINTAKDELTINKVEPIVNGEKGMDIVVDDELKSPVNSFHSNGLRTGILHEAIRAIEDRKLRQTSERYLKSTIKCVNGVLETKRGIIANTKDNSNTITDSNDRKLTHFDVCGNSNKKLPKVSLSNGYSTDGIRKNDEDNNPTCENNSACISSSGDVINNEIDNELEKNSSFRYRGLHSSHRFLKRRRKWGSKRRLFTPRRRRDVMSSKHMDSSSTLRVPLKFDPVPGSVLGPSWKPADSLSIESSVVNTGSDSALVESSIKDNDENASISNGVSNRMNKSESNNCKTSESPEVDSESGCTTHNDIGLTCSENSSNTSDVEKPVLYLCEWECCTATFESKHQVAYHVYTTHLPNKESGKVDGSQHTNHKSYIQLVRRCCRWRGCQSASLARAPFALMTHVLDMHCSPKELEMRRSNHEKSKIECTTADFSYDINTTTGSDTHPEYPFVGDRTGWGIIRSIEAKIMQNDLLAAQHHFLLTNPHCQPNVSLNPLLHSSMVNPPREGPVTKHLRVTSALILKNLAIHVDQARRWLLKESQLLSEIAFGCTPSETGLKTNNANHIIAQCLSICALKQNPLNRTMTQTRERPENIPLLLEHPYPLLTESIVCCQFKPSTTVDLDSECCN